MDFQKHFAQGLIERRDQLGLTPSELATRSEIPLTHLEAIERSEEQPEMGTLLQLANVFGVPVEALLNGLTWKPGEGFSVTDPR